jgi:hypothetical protein
MGLLSERGSEVALHERAITSLSARTGISPAEVRALFVHELARLELRAKVRTYLSVLTTSKVRAMLPAKAQHDVMPRSHSSTP